ncbi:hypothetical protein D3C78_1020340 [compost metagenome]
MAIGAPVQFALNRLLQHFQRGFHQFFWCDDRIHQADFQCIFGTDVLTGGNNFQCAVVTQKAWQANGAAEARHNTQFGFRQADTRIRRRNAEVGRQNTFAAAAERIAVNGRNGRHRQIFQPVKDRIGEVQPLLQLFSRGSKQRKEFGDVGADNKGGLGRTQQQAF